MNTQNRKFAPDRISDQTLASVFRPYQVHHLISIQDGLQKQAIYPDTDLIVATVNQTYRIALVRNQVAYHHIIKGQHQSTNYLLTFCDVCNSGMVFENNVHGKPLNFYVAGVYNAVMLMADKETNSYWDHMTGECLYGTYKGKKLQIIGSHQFFKAGELAVQNPKLPLAITQQSLWQRLFGYFQTKMNNPLKGHQLFFPPGFKKSVAFRDQRLPDYEMGLGLWYNNKAKYYPLTAVQKMSYPIVDRLSGQDIIIAFNDKSETPKSFFLQSPIADVSRQGTIKFVNGDKIENGFYYTPDGKAVFDRQPNQIFSRWYGFSLTFNGCGIFEPITAVPAMA